MNKEEQKKLLIEIMEADEKDGLYEINNMAQQTAVEWYANELLGLMVELATNTIAESEYHIKRRKSFEQAKQMEKEQIIKANILGMQYVHCDENQWEQYAEQYYNKTYGK